ncbi:hypothetical protein [Niveibacterium sp. COAC-50]|uniref:hypothetical protein n=1 Tax=Niveibacterium sp. COAC-50 TaxID=2729384 RepID=UPI0015575E0E|nr:hypothetical protein [Niveibacterium sp. COAC-50]
MYAPRRPTIQPGRSDADKDLSNTLSPKHQYFRPQLFDPDWKPPLANYVIASQRTPTIVMGDGPTGQKGLDRGW